MDIDSSVAELPIDSKFYCLFRDELLNCHTFLGEKEWEVSTDSKQKVLK